MNPKALLMLCLILFAFASTITTIATATNTPTPDTLSVTQSLAFSVGSGDIQPCGGDEVDNPVLPC